MDECPRVCKQVKQSISQVVSVTATKTEESEMYLSSSRSMSFNCPSSPTNPSHFPSLLSSALVVVRFLTCSAAAAAAAP